MTFTLEQAAVQRAKAALTLAAQESSQAARRKAFIRVAFELLRNENESANARLKTLAKTDPLIERAISHDIGSPEWAHGARPLAEAFLGSIAEYSLLDSIKQHCRVLPNASSGRALVASGSVGDLVTEGDPVPCRNLNLSIGDIEPTRSAAMVILSEELVRIGGPAVMQLFEEELVAALGRASNSAVLSAVIESGTASVPGTGDPLEDLRAGLQAAGPGDAFVVAAPAGAVRTLATHQEALPGFSVRGGEFRPGLELVGVESLNDTIIIPASRLAVWDAGLTLRSAEHAAVNMQDSPQSPAQHVSLFQAGLLGLAVERRWHLGGDTGGVVVIEGESS